MSKHKVSKKTIRATLAMVRAERDHLLLLLAILAEDGIPDGPLSRAVRCAIAQESESDIDRQHAARDTLRAKLLY